MPGQNHFIQFFKKLGPGLITGASDDDPSGIATYSQAGAQFGLMTLWMAFFTFPLMVAIQEMCGRIGLVTGEGLTHVVQKHYPNALLYLIIALTLPAMVLNIAADIASMGAVAHMLVPAIHADIFCILITVILAFTIIYLTYNQIVKFLKYFCLSLLFYLIVPFLTNTDWYAVFKAVFAPKININKEYLTMMVALLGTTISPYMFFWQATMAAEEGKKRKQNLNQCINNLRIDVSVGMFSSNVVMFFIILTTGSVLFSHGIQQINTVEEAAKALEPLAGSFAYTLFALGILGTGFLTIPVLCSGVSYILATPLKIKNGLNKQFNEAKIFYFIILSSLFLALTINFMGLSPIRALLWTAGLYGVTAPVMIGLILIISNNKRIMKHHTNGPFANILGGCGFILMSCTAGLFIYYSF
jgi:NRAMP (natural resistance-associated macrophage protein)-like metal ion transporter